MDGRIAELTCEYVARGVEQAAAAAHLDQIARVELPAVLGTLLDSVYGDDPAVYVVREVRAEFALRADGPAAGRRWAEALATAIVRTVAHDPADGVNLVRFADDAEYVASYLVEHVRGEAGPHWYFRPLAAWHYEPTGIAARALLTERPALPVLAALHRQGMLTTVLDTLTDQDITDLAGVPEQPAPTDDVSGLWPLLTAAVTIAELCGLWAATPLSALDVALHYRSRAVPDWRSTTALTMIVVDILRQLAAAGHVRSSVTPPPPALADRFGWLDVDLLFAGLTAARPNVMGQREKQVLRALETVLTDSPTLRTAVRSAGPGPRAALLLHAGVTVDHPEWTDDGLVTAVVAGVLARWSAGTADPVVALVTAVDHTAVEESEYAGVLLLLRAIADLRLPAVLARAGIPHALPYVLLAIACRLTGADPHDPAVQAFAGRPPDIRRNWRQAHHLSSLRREVRAQARVQRLPELSDADLPHGRAGKPKVDATVGLLACAVMRTWSRWLGQFSESTIGYLLAHFVHRPGRLRWTDDELVVELASGPLDVVVSLAGYDKPLESVPWLGDRTVTYRMAAS